MTTLAQVSVFLCLLAAAPVAVADDPPRFRGQARLTPATAADGERFQLNARLLPSAAGAADRFQLSARLQSDAQVKAIAAVCADGLYSNGFE